MLRGWLVRPLQGCPERRLFAAVLMQAIRDAQRGQTELTVVPMDGRQGALLTVGDCAALLARLRAGHALTVVDAVQPHALWPAVQAAADRIFVVAAADRPDTVANAQMLAGEQDDQRLAVVINQAGRAVAEDWPVQRLKLEVDHTLSVVPMTAAEARQSVDEIKRREAIIEEGIEKLRQHAPAEIAAGPVDGLLDYWADRLGIAEEPAYEVHELGQLFPMLTGREFDGMVESVKARGLLQPITLYEGKILDGKARYAACKRSGVTPRFQTFPDDFPSYRGSAQDFVMSANLIRASYTESQRAMVAARMASGGAQGAEV